MNQIACGGKVFIVGEYACIEGGPALLGTIAPEFSITIERSNDCAPSSSMHEQSPAGLYLRSQEHVLKGVRLIWDDPYATPIGVGSSSAQFILSVAAIAHLKGQPLPTAKSILELYWKTVGQSQGIRPSGADVVAQWVGGNILFRNKPFECRSLRPWSSDAQFILAYTGHKAKTHEHLLKLEQAGFPHAYRSSLQHLDNLTLKALQAWEDADARSLGLTLNEYQSALLKAGLASAEFTAALGEIQKLSGVLGCKGSGAQGGDCVLLLVERPHTQEIMQSLSSRGWQPQVIQWTTSCPINATDLGRTS